MIYRQETHIRWKHVGFLDSPIVSKAGQFIRAQKEGEYRKYLWKSDPLENTTVDKMTRLSHSNNIINILQTHGQLYNTSGVSSIKYWCPSVKLPGNCRQYVMFVNVREVYLHPKSFNNLVSTQFGSYLCEPRSSVFWILVFHWFRILILQDSKKKDNDIRGQEKLFYPDAFLCSYFFKNSLRIKIPLCDACCVVVYPSQDVKRVSRHLYAMPLFFRIK